jgi:uncharacterized protein (TIGR00369 family)
MDPKLELIDNQRCFACGPDNPHGLRLNWCTEGNTMYTEMIPSDKYQGWKGIVHGGILATLLDEAMTRLASILHGGALTAEITVRYIKPAQIGQKLYIRGEIVKESRKLIEMKASIQLDNASGTLIASSTGKSIKKHPPLN